MIYPFALILPRSGRVSLLQIERWRGKRYEFARFWFKLFSMKSSMIIFLILLFASCTKELKYSKEELFSKALKADSSVTFIIPKSMGEGVSCTSYPEGCLSAHIVQVRHLDLIAVEFMTEEQAKYAAKKVRGYYLRNWILDDVAGEPELERFAEQSLEAKKP